MKALTLFVSGAVLSLAAITHAASEGSKLTPQELDFFEQKIRPVLTEKCYKCHSSQPDAKIKAGLALDTREGLLKGGDSGPSIKVGKPAESLLMKSLHGTDPDLLMPPAKDGGKLPDNVIASFEQWIKMGAPDPRVAKAAVSKYAPDPLKAKEHRFFNPVKPIEVPVVKNQKWTKTPVDSFILAKLETNAMEPSGPADKLTLIRRVYFDLTGMPPSAEEVDAFMADRSSKAFEKVVDRLLSSPQYGERWGRYWLDVARYGDTMGDTIRNKDNRYLYSYTYRDYVINAFNTDKPYDQFLVEQIAADRLPLGEDKSALAALGFLSLGNRFGNDANQVIDDRIDVVCRGTMGLTVTCARCHDHKFDPIVMKDYYALHGVFNSITEPAEPPLLKPVKETEAYHDFQKKLAAAEAELAHAQATNVHTIITNQHARVGEYLLAIHEFTHSDPSAGLNRNSFFRNRDLDTQLAGNLERALKQLSKKHDAVFTPWNQFSAIDERNFAEEAKALTAKFRANSEPTAKINPLLARQFLVTPKDMKEVAQLYGKVFADIDRQWQVLLAVKKDADPKTTKLSDPNAEAIRQVLYGEGAPLTISEREIARLTSQQTEAKENLLIRKVNEVKMTHPGSPARAMALQDMAKPRDSAIFLRGNPNNRGPVVPRQFLQIIAKTDAKPFQEGSGRLDLARAIASKDNPLTARVMVNRIWHYHFGQGIVVTPSDFGLVGEPPTHPELLDWLAGQFMDHNWSIKHIHRLILLSATWQQSSDINPKYATKDQGNALLWRQNRFRLDFEGTRDTLLAVSGALDRTMGGQPVDLAQDPGPTRRTVYGYINRAALPEFFNTFDFAPPDISSPMRVMTTVPQQALFLMNSPFVIQQAKALSTRPEVVKAASTEAKVKTIYRLLYQRAPSSTELKIAVQFINEQLGHKPPVVEAPAWKYGQGWYDPQTKRVKQFAVLGVFDQNKWQSARRAGSLMLDAQGGLTGVGPKQAVIRRWTAPQDASISIAAQLSPKDAKLGVAGHIVSNLRGELCSYDTKSGKVNTNLGKIDVKKGETIDFVVESLDAKNPAGFQWSPTIALTERESAEQAQEKYEWHAQSEFAGPPPPPLKGMNPWEKYAQAMLLSNELVFVN